MEYYEMSIDDAIQFLREYHGKTVLIAVKNLEDDDNASFTSMGKNDCESLILEAETIASVHDDFVRQLRLFSHKQNIRNIIPLGWQKTILLRI